MAGNAEILGLGDLTKLFGKLKDDMKLRTSRRMVAAAGGVLRKEARAIAQSKGLKVSGALIKNIVIKRERNAPEGTEQYHLGVRHGRGLGNGKKITKYLAYSKRKGRVVIKRKDDPFYWRFVEFGHKIVGRSTGESGTGITSYVTTLRNGEKANRTRKYHLDSITGRRRGSKDMVQPIPFIGPALVNKKQEAIAAMEDRLNKDLAKANK